MEAHEYYQFFSILSQPRFTENRVIIAFVIRNIVCGMLERPLKKDAITNICQLTNNMKLATNQSEVGHKLLGVLCGLHYITLFLHLKNGH